MGIFDFLKKKRTISEPPEEKSIEDEYTETAKGYFDEAMDVFQQALKNGILTEETDEHNMLGQSWDKLEDDGSLPLGWASKHQAYFDEFAKSMVNYATTYSALTCDEKIHMLQKMIAEYYDFKKECFEKGETFRKYFSDMWCHCHNSRNSDFEYIEPYEKELEHLKEHREEIIRKESIVDQYAKDLDKNVMQIIEAHPEGIKQTEIYKHFPVELKSHIQEILYFSAKEQTIIREKSGNSYIIRPKGGNHG